jgi:DNA polymerase-3 subunit chi
MTEIAFYHLQQSSLEVALVQLLDLTLKANKRAVVRVGTLDRITTLDAALWVQGKDSWLPHGSEEGGYAEDQPIWLTTENKNPNSADYLFLTDGSEIEDIASFERCFDLFDGNDDVSVIAARDRWKFFKGSGHDLHYWQQNDYGKWEEKS